MGDFWGPTEGGPPVPMMPVLAELGTIADMLPEVCASLVARGRLQARQFGLSVAVATGADAVAQAAPAWRMIEDAGGANTPFQTLAVAEAASRVHVAQGETPRIVVVREHDRPVAIFPTVTATWNGFPAIRFLGDPLIQYGDILAAPEVRDRHLAAAWEAAADPAFGRMVYLRKVRADARIAPLLARETVALNPQEAPFVALDRPPAQGRAARELNRLRRRLAEHGDLRFEVFAADAALAPLREALAIKGAWLAERGLPSKVIGCTAWEDALVRLAANPRGGLRVARLKAGAATVAIEIALEHRGAWYAFLGATVPRFAKAGPGHVQMADTMDHCRARGHALYDLLAPAEPYKRAMGTGSVAVSDHAAALATTGRLALLLVQSKPVIKQCLDALPSRLRAALLAMRRA